MRGVVDAITARVLHRAAAAPSPPSPASGRGSQAMLCGFRRALSGLRRALHSRDLISVMPGGPFAPSPACGGGSGRGCGGATAAGVSPEWNFPLCFGLANQAVER